MRAKDIPPHLHDRYGIRPPSPWRWVAAAAVIAVAVPVGIYAASRYVVTQQVPFALISWAAPNEHRVQVRWELEPVNAPQWCAIRAQDFAHFDVGFVVVPVPSGASSMRYTMTTLVRPLAVDVVECSTDPYGLAGPQFAPGVRPPVQAAPGLTPGVHAPESLGLLH